MITLGQNIRAARTTQGITQQAAANAAGVTHVTWNRWENNRARPSIDSLKRVATALGTTLSVLLDGV